MGYVKLDAIPEAKYLCDTKEDLALLLPRPSFGDTCWVIEEAAEYIYNSKGQWLPMSNASAGAETKVDLTGYATEDYVQEQIQNIEHPVVEVPSKLSELENDANYAQQGYVDAKVADLVNSAPETLDTIGEIAQALKDHQDVADAITEAIGKKADKEDLPSIEGLASETFVTEAIQKIEFPVTDLSDYYTKDEVTQAIIDNAELPEGELAHQYLTTDAEGNKVWETKLAYIDYEEKLFIAESVWDGTQLSFPVAELEANNGDRCSIYLDDIEYKGTVVNGLHTYTVNFDEGVSFPWPYFNIAKPGYNSNIGGQPITWLVGKLRATVQLSTPHTINSKYLNFDIQSTGKYDLVINNYNGTGSAHANSVSINGGVAEGEQSIALSYASKAQGTGSLAVGTSTAKGTYSAAFGAGTVANSRGSISFGEQNIEDVDKKYVMIAGNGHTDINFSTGQMTEVHSNVHTLDWDGNARYAGDVYVQGTDVDDLQDAKKVATEEYVNSLLGNKADSTDIVQADWDENNSESNAYVMNRPFYDSRTNVIEWDGETSDTIITIPEMGVTLYRVSDTPLTKAELGMVTYYNFGNTKGYTNLNSDLDVSSDGKIISEDQTYAFMSVLEDGAVMHIGAGVKDVVFEKKGIYFWELKFSATLSLKTQKIKYGSVTQIPDYYISDKIARQSDLDWVRYNTTKTVAIYAADLNQDIITEVHPGGYIAGTGKNYTNNLPDAFDYDGLKKYLEVTGYYTNIGIHWLTAQSMGEKRQALDLHMGEDGIGFHFIKDITFDEATGQPKFNLKKVWIANPNYVAE